MNGSVTFRVHASADAPPPPQGIALRGLAALVVVLHLFACDGVLSGRDRDLERGAADRGGSRCGNGKCSGQESCHTCPEDCGGCDGTALDGALGLLDQSPPTVDAASAAADGGPQPTADSETPLPDQAPAKPDASGPPPSCDLWASPTGSDSGAGSLTSPFKTPKKLVAALSPGEVGCFRAGTYSFDSLSIAKANLTLRPHLAEQVVLKGSIRINPGGDGTIIEWLHLDGDGPTSKHGPNIYASNVSLRHNDITNNNTGICIQVRRYGSSGPRPQHVLIENNRVHHCGALPPTNHHHGIYIGRASYTVVRDNWFYENADRGVQQYPDADDSEITGNVIVSNKEGVNFSCDSGSCSQRNVVSGNIIANNSNWNVYGHSQGATPDGSNDLNDNCVWFTGGTDGISSNSKFFSEQGNIIAKPTFVNATGSNYKLTPGDPCLAKYTGTMSLP